MRSNALTLAGLRLARWRTRPSVSSAVFWIMVVLGPVLALATFVVLGDMEWLGVTQSASMSLLPGRKSDQASPGTSPVVCQTVSN
jgi:hypothetical protein